MKKIFIGFAFGDTRGRELLNCSKSGLQMAANQYQLGFLTGLNEVDNIISATSIGAFPFHNRRLFFKQKVEKSTVGDIIHLPFFNFYFFP